jgi:Na+/H+ antiporter NhaD/arsenite permease-like protein
LKDTSRPPSPLAALRGDVFFWALLIACLLLSLAMPHEIPRYPRLVDWTTIATLAGLLALTKGVELSGWLAHLGRRLIAAMPSERALAMLLMLATALLATALTNDVGLFVMVPLTVGLRGVASLPVTRLVVFEAMAANAGSSLTPIGNPQNLFLWHLSGVPFERYMLDMLPMVAIMMAVLLLLTACAFSGRRLAAIVRDGQTAVDRRLLWLSLALYPPFLVLIDLQHALPALLLVAAVFAWQRREVLARLDWALLLVFILMFIDLRLIAQLPAMRELMAHAGLAQPQRLYLAGIAGSQLVSNVPAAILLMEYTSDWRLVAQAVNIGGFGFVLGSLANIIALRLGAGPDARRAWMLFHAYSIPFLLAAGGLVYFLLF